MTTSSYAERFQDIAILQLNTEGFAALTLRQKRLAYHLAQAGLWGRAISMDQGSVHNLPLIEALMALYEASQREPSASVSTKQDLRVDICSKCHPFFTGKQKLVDTGGRVDRFKKRFNMTEDKK